MLEEQEKTYDEHLLYRLRWGTDANFARITRSFTTRTASSLRRWPGRVVCGRGLQADAISQ